MSRARWRHALAGATLGLGLGLLPIPARADDTESTTRVTVTNTLTTEYWGDNANQRDDDDDFGVLVDRLNLGVTAGELSGALRFDVIQVLAPPTDQYGDTVTIERFSLKYRRGAWTFTGGDFFRQLGRGIMLSIRKVDEAGVDLSIRGGELDYAGEVHRLSLFAGAVNPGNIDPVSRKKVEDSNDLLVGGRYELARFELATFGLLGLYQQPRERIVPDERDATINGGVYVEMPALAEGLALYLEADVQDRRLIGEHTLGKALYATADATLGPLVFLLEGLYLDEWEQRGSRNTALNTRFDYNQPPTLERLDQEVFNNRDTLGGRLRVETTFDEPYLVLYANAAFRMNDFGEQSEVRSLHGFGGFEYYWDDGASRLLFAAGYRDEWNDVGQIRSLINLDIDYLHAIGEEGAAFHILSNSQFRTLQEQSFVRGSTLIGFEQAGTGGVTFEIGYDTQNPSEEVRNLFLAAIFSLDVTEWLRVRATGGTQRGGIKCVAGVCRVYPEFAGATAELIVRL